MNGLMEPLIDIVAYGEYPSLSPSLNLLTVTPGNRRALKVVTRWLDQSYPQRGKGPCY